MNAYRRKPKALAIPDSDREKYQQRIVQQTARRNGHWTWMGALNSQQEQDDPALLYGRMSIAGRAEYAHRAAFVAFIRDLKRGEYVLHTCDNPRCVNPDHLIAGSHQENMRDMIERERGRMQFPKEAPF